MKRQHVVKASMAIIWIVVACTWSLAATLEVGAGKTYAKPSQAFAAAKDGDTIEIASGDYANDWCRIRANNLVIRGVGKARARFVSSGMIDNGKGIFVASGNNLTIENIEFSGARVSDRNGCGIRAEGKDLTVRNCRFYDCEDGIQGGAGEILIERCEFDHCGHSAGSVATHSCYISQRCTKLTFRYNYSTHTLEGHLLKSRARETLVLYNRLTDEEGLGSAVADFPNGGQVVLIGNVLHKGPNAHNNRMIAFGMEGLIYPVNAIYVVNNTMWWDNRRPEEMTFVFVRNSAAKVAGSTSQPTTKDVTTVIRNNVCVGPIPLTNAKAVDAGGNLLFKTVADAGFVDPAKYDFHLTANSPCVNKGVDCAKFGAFSLKPDCEYVHPQDSRPRPDDGKIDGGAFEYVPIAVSRPS